MISLSTLRTSQLEALGSSLAQGERVKEFIQATTRFLTNSQVDGGADSDLIATTGYRLALANVWNHVKPEDLAAAWKSVPISAVRLFLDDAPSEYATQILRGLEGKPKPNPRQRHVTEVVYTAKKGYVPRGWSKSPIADRARDVSYGFTVGLAPGPDLAAAGSAKKRTLLRSRAQKVIDAKAARLARLLVSQDDDDDRPGKGGRPQQKTR
ncbi:hypothetical protein [Rhizobium leguminosarum]|uniref:hypothetical protein n=1 Tax=Rhizobium leguminosarum TaxID=384 RepID=UPI00103EA8E3|nr:hypothetical protein [Rhizobium leguminosarum]TBY49359.1 hypothetical protein E0H54_06510 [Rhizobium leguminosarum bv. viciae]